MILTPPAIYVKKIMFGELALEAIAVINGPLPMAVDLAV
jgi:hypothetical protein